MKIMIKYIAASILSCCFILFSVHSFAQNESSLSSIAQTIGAIYENLDGPYVTTGYLKDKAVDLIKLPAHTGQALTDSTPSYFIIIRQIIG